MGLDPDELRFVGEHSNKTRMWHTDNVLVVALADGDLLFPIGFCPMAWTFYVRALGGFVIEVMS